MMNRFCPHCNARIGYTERLGALSVFGNRCHNCTHKIRASRYWIAISCSAMFAYILFVLFARPESISAAYVLCFGTVIVLISGYLTDVEKMNHESEEHKPQ